MLKIVSFLLFFVVFAVWLFIHTFIYKNMTLDQQFKSCNPEGLKRNNPIII